MSNLITTPGVYAITDTHLLPDDTQLLAGVEGALRGGAVCIQYRDKIADASKALRQARELAALCRDFSVPLIINDDVLLAKACQADGVHLGQTDGRIDEARAYLGKNVILGRTCHASLKLAEEAYHEGADYLAFGRCFGSQTKPSAPATSMDIFAKAAVFGLPLVAIGGLDTPERAVQAQQAGAHLIAAVAGVFAQADPETAVKRYNQALTTESTFDLTPSTEVNYDSLCRTL
ncbi:thiamine phosphate synthase [Marinospirillum perlucidum]|uniref:thiamine phosphate synthase n=1 Tax=Marinospirillum perlucidum TaxID=1982602 RepID=UPI000DF28388|nr:thiamine phosphate synthase [Marinospirillum perlucidum]